MAEYEEQEGGTFLFIENHCPVCAAATAYQGFCRAEQQIFGQVLKAQLERVAHMYI